MPTNSTVYTQLINARVDTTVPIIRPTVLLNIDGGFASTVFSPSSVSLSGGGANLVVDPTIPLADGGTA